jgi:hypothetical protein
VDAVRLIDRASRPLPETLCVRPERKPVFKPSSPVLIVRTHAGWAPRSPPFRMPCAYRRPMEWCYLPCRLAATGSRPTARRRRTISARKSWAVRACWGLR